MPVQFKGISEYQNKFKVRSRSTSPHRRMLAGLRSDQLGISREPQFLSRRKVPSYTPQVSSSFQWNGRAESPRRQDSHGPGSPLAVTPAARASSPERAETPLAPRGPRPPGASSASPQAAVAQDHTQPHIPSAAGERPGPALNGVQRALRRKAGLRSAVHRSGRQSSEYQRQFMWKTPVAESPLLAAEQMLYTSSRSIPPFKSNPAIAESEYTRNFKISPAPRAPRLRQDVEGHGVPLFHRESVPHSERKRKKRKEQPHSSRKSSPKPHVPQPEQDSPQQEVRSQNAQQGVPAHTTGYRKVKSEYNSNFHSPLQYCYRDGAWVKSCTAAAEGDHSHEWYHEVQELREKAEAYRRRAWGTHFSRQHLSQLLSEQNRLWEPSTATTSSAAGSEGSSVGSSPLVEALDLARVESGRGSPSPGASVALTPNSSRSSSAGEAALHDGPTLPVQRRLAWEEEAEPGGAERKQRGGEPHAERREEEPKEEKEEERKKKKGDVKDRKDELRVPEPRSPTVGSGSSREEGRLPTPKLKTMLAARRTHHDRTTPAAGGAILVSPPKTKNSSRRERRSEPPLGKLHSPYRHLHQALPPQAASKAEDGSPPRASPAAGLTTVDPLPLRKDSWSGDVVEEPPDPRPARSSRKRTTSARPRAALPANRIQGTLRNAEFQHNGNLGLHRPELFVFPSSESTWSDNDDRMSQISSRSAASCSMASQVLGRAQRRRDDFWGKS